MSQDLHNVTDTDVTLKWREQYVSAALNKKDASIGRGIVRGAVPWSASAPDGSGHYGITIDVDPSTSETVVVAAGPAGAVDFKGDYFVTWRTKTGVYIPFDVAVFTVALGWANRNAYIYFIPGYSSGSATVAKIVAYKEAEVETNVPDNLGGIFLCCVQVPGAVEKIRNDKIAHFGQTSGTGRAMSRQYASESVGGAYSSQNSQIARVFQASFDTSIMSTIPQGTAIAAAGDAIEYSIAAEDNLFVDQTDGNFLTGDGALCFHYGATGNHGKIQLQTRLQPAIDLPRSNASDVSGHMESMQKARVVIVYKTNAAYSYAGQVDDPSGVAVSLQNSLRLSFINNNFTQTMGGGHPVLVNTNGEWKSLVTEIPFDKEFLAEYNFIGGNQADTMSIGIELVMNDCPGGRIWVDSVTVDIARSPSPAVSSISSLESRLWVNTGPSDSYCGDRSGIAGSMFFVRKGGLESVMNTAGVGWAVGLSPTGRLDFNPWSTSIVANKVRFGGSNVSLTDKVGNPVQSIDGAPTAGVDNSIYAFEVYGNVSASTTSDNTKGVILRNTSLVLRDPTGDYAAQTNFLGVEGSTSQVMFDGSMHAGGGYGSAGVTISTVGGLSANGDLVVDGDVFFAGGYGSGGITFSNGAMTAASTIKAGLGYGFTGVTLSSGGSVSADGDLFVNGKGTIGASDGTPPWIEGDLTVCNNGNDLASVLAVSDTSYGGTLDRFTGMYTNATAGLWNWKKGPDGAKDNNSGLSVITANTAGMVFNIGNDTSPDTDIEAPLGIDSSSNVRMATPVYAHNELVAMNYNNGSQGWFTPNSGSFGETTLRVYGSQAGSAAVIHGSATDNTVQTGANTTKIGSCLALTVPSAQNASAWAGTSDGSVFLSCGTINAASQTADADTGVSYASNFVWTSSATMGMWGQIRIEPAALAGAPAFYFSGYSVGSYSLSDERIKTNIESIDSLSCLDRISGLRPVYFSLIDSDNGRQEPGFIAQEALVHFPDDRDGVAFVEKHPKTVGDLEIEDPHGMNQTTLIPYLCGAIKELKSQIDELKAEVAALKGA